MKAVLVHQRFTYSANSPASHLLGQRSSIDYECGYSDRVWGFSSACALLAQSVSCARERVSREARRASPSPHAHLPTAATFRVVAVESAEDHGASGLPPLAKSAMAARELVCGGDVRPPGRGRVDERDWQRVSRRTPVRRWLPGDVWPGVPQPLRKRGLLATSRPTPRRVQGLAESRLDAVAEHRRRLRPTLRRGAM
jgi:hypothetical protein